MTLAAHGLALRDLTKRHGAVAAVEGVDLDVAPGEFLTLLGPSGAGKTTILMAIAGFVAPTRGSILLEGRDITHVPAERRNFGVVFQGYALFPHLSAAGNVAYPLEVRGITGARCAERVAAMLRLVQLEALGARMPRQLSGGEQQRVALARALVFDPSVVLLDEPLGALDKKLRTELQFELRSLHRRIGGTFIHVTHDQEEAITLSDRIAVLRHGRIVQIGAPAALYEKPETRFVAEFLGRSNFLEGRITAIDGGMALVQCGTLRFRQALGDRGDFSLGARVVMALRPDRLRPSLPGLAADVCTNRLCGKVIGAVYGGAVGHVVVETPDHKTVYMSLPLGRGEAMPTEGEQICLEWASDAAVIVRDDG